MPEKSSFEEVKTKHLETLKTYVPIVARVHGPTHPEFYKVRDIYDQMVLKISAPEQSDLTSDFASLRKITSNYTIPGDVCESYAAVYNMLADLDKAYSA